MSHAATDLATANPSTIARTEVQHGERLIWADRAVRRRPTLGALKFVVFGLIFAGFGALWMVLAWAGTSSADDLLRLFPLFGVPFVLVGLAIASAPLWAGMLGGPTIYALTDQRVFMLSGRRTRLARSTPLEKLGQLITSEESDGTGNIVFGGVMLAESGDRLALINGLYGIRDVRRVRGLIEREEARRAATVGAAS